MNFFAKTALSLTALFTGCLVFSQHTFAQTNYQVREQPITVQKQLYGKLYLPQNRQGKVPLIIYSHGLGGTHTNLENFAQALADKGIAGYVFDFQGGGRQSQSSGKTTEMSVLTEVADLEDVINQARQWDFVDHEKIILIGGSQGGVVSALAAANNPHKVAGMVLFYPAFVLEDEAKQRFPDLTKPAQDVPDFHGWIDLGGVYFDVARSLDPYGRIAQFNKPVLIVHGEKDPVVPTKYAEKAQQIYAKADLHIIKDAPHSFKDEPFFKEALEQVEKYLAEKGLNK
ncbi:alpha/beta fold hydrolase [Bibersteinia trehalosi]|uniref:Alpha/beta fold hydrolase n=1 Tax=Bibersteinia trehalosi TaxID=47735 RepID=A0A3R8MIT0_BIBTR|nr:alpha/beta fold hydrolase [Bibersteinia trehalosi]RRN05806.1 alpha/beta fold hydrolase [Bibersteinia trehalosi]